MLIATTNIPEKIDPSLKRRFDRIIKVELPDKKVRLDILEHYTSKMPIHSQLDLEKLAELTERLSGADLECLCKKVKFHPWNKFGFFNDLSIFNDVIWAISLVRFEDFYF